MLDGLLIIMGGDENTKIKKPFQIKNTRKLDAIRDKIDKLDLCDIDKSVILTSLILSLDKVDNTLGHFSSYLSGWSTRSNDDIILKVPHLVKTQGCHKVLRKDIYDALRYDCFDLVYFDPPYGSNNEKMPSSRVRYSSYYHFWTSVVKNDKPKLFGKVNRREDTRDEFSSVFEEFKTDEIGNSIVMEAVKTLIKDSNTRYILFSYSSGGKLTKEEIEIILNNAGKILKIIEVNHKKNVMSAMKWTNEWAQNDVNKEYLFLMEKI